MKDSGVKDYRMEELTSERILSIYTGVAKEHFPEAELKPVDILARSLKNGTYEGLGLFDGATLMGYAFFAKAKEGKVLLLDYYAVMAEYRNGGTGSLFLQKMKTFYGDRTAIILETEEPALAENEAERDLRTRRNGFYMRNGAIPTRIKTRLYAVELGILYIPLKSRLSTEQIMKELDAIYREMLNEENHKKYVRLYS